MTQPACNTPCNLLLARVVEVIAIRNDLHLAGTFCAARKFLGGIKISQLLVAAQVQRRASDARRELENVGTVPQVEEALGGNRVPPAREKHQLPSGSPAD